MVPEDVAFQAVEPEGVVHDRRHEECGAIKDGGRATQLVVGQVLGEDDDGERDEGDAEEQEQIQQEERVRGASTIRKMLWWLIHMMPMTMKLMT